ncbi:MAG: hypothetical protein AB8G96_16370 [Phycisphaerales bacterium]
MDPAVALVQAYLYANHYFTVTEYPVVESLGGKQYRAITDVDVLAVRFPRAGRLIPAGSRRATDDVLDGADPQLGAPEDRIHLIIGEVKEGRAELNRGARDPGTLRAALRRIGHLSADRADSAVESLRRNGRYETPEAVVQLFAFGSYPGDRGGYRTIVYRRMIRFMRQMAQENWSMLQSAQFKDPALSFLVLLMKSRFDQPERQEPRGRDRRRNRPGRGAGGGGSGGRGRGGGGGGGRNDDRGGTRH